MADSTGNPIEGNREYIKFQLETFQLWGEISRKWVQALDTKAALISGMNAVLLTLLWSGLKLGEASEWPLWLALAATATSGASFWQAMIAVLPRHDLSSALGKTMKYQNAFKPLSYFGYVAAEYPAGKLSDFYRDAQSLDGSQLLQEALEQHYVISHIAYQKSKSIRQSGMTWMGAVGLALLATAIK